MLELWCTGDDAAEGLGDCLVAQAHAKRRDCGAKSADQLDRNTCVARDTWARRDDDEVWRELARLLDGDGVIAFDRDARAELAQILVQVVGEAVVVVDQQDVGTHATTSSFLSERTIADSIRSASPTAARTACALFSVSWYSVAG